MFKIVYVDDHPIRDPTSLTLELKGFEVVTARNGAECIELAHAWSPDLIIMDLRMPNMDGFEAIRQLRLDPMTAHIPIFILSAWTSRTHRERALAAGATKFFAKPVNLERLLDSIAQLSNLYLGKSFIEEENKSSTLNISPIESPLPEIISPALKSSSIPYIAGPPIIDSKMFFGREQILQKIVNTIHNNNVLVTGRRRIGKTSLLHQLKKRLTNLDDASYFFIPVFVDMQGTPEQAFFYTIMDEIMATIPEYLPEQALPPLDFNPADSNYNDRSFGKDLGKIIKTLQKNYPDKTVKLVLLLDEMDVMNSYDQQVQSRLRRIFQKDFAHNLGAVVVGVNLRQQWERYESPFYNMFTPLTLEPFSPEQARELITRPVEGVYSYDEPAIQRILAATEGHPFRLQQLCLEITQRATQEKRRQITLADIEVALTNIQWIEAEIGQFGQETTAQPQPAIAVLAEKAVPYHPSTPPQSTEAAE
jgi:CheY-like chemotaxis protein